MKELQKFEVPDFGECDGFAYEFNERKYIQLEILTPVAERMGEWAVKLDIMGVNSFMDLGNVKWGQILSSIMRGENAIGLLSIILLHDDFTPVDPEEFRKTKFVKFAAFVREVALDFFHLNASLVDAITASAEKFRQGLGVVKNLWDQLLSLELSQPLPADGPQKSAKRGGKSGKKI